MIAYVEIFVEPGRDTIASAEFLRMIEGVKEAYPVSQHCDIIVFVEAGDFRQIYELVMSKIEIIKGIVKTKILPCIDLDIE